MTTATIFEKAVKNRDKVQFALDAANRRKRSRTLALEDIRELACDALPKCIDGGRVANSYSYQAFTTGAVAVRIRGRVWVLIREVVAKGGTGFGDVMRRTANGPKWIGPTAAKDLRNAGFIAIDPTWLDETFDAIHSDYLQEI